MVVKFNDKDSKIKIEKNMEILWFKTINVTNIKSLNRHNYFCLC